MKKIIICILIGICIEGCANKHKELFSETDAFVESLQTTFDSYGMNGLKYAKTTSDGYYTIMPMGRLINVKIEKAVEDKVYEDLKEDLEKHYKNDTRVNDVYINKGGTIMIDCRN